MPRIAIAASSASAQIDFTSSLLYRLARHGRYERRRSGREPQQQLCLENRSLRQGGRLGWRRIDIGDKSSQRIENSLGDLIKIEWDKASRCRRQRQHRCRYRMIEALDRMTYIKRERGRRILVDGYPKQRLHAANDKRDRQDRAVYSRASAVGRCREMLHELLPPRYHAQWSNRYQVPLRHFASS